MKQHISKNFMVLLITELNKYKLQKVVTKYVVRTSWYENNISAKIMSKLESIGLKRRKRSDGSPAPYQAAHISVYTLNFHG